MADQDFSVFLAGVHRVIKDSGQGVPEYRRGLFKAYPMFLYV
jgi:hypothetical protein